MKLYLLITVVSFTVALINALPVPYPIPDDQTMDILGATTEQSTEDGIVDAVAKEIVRGIFVAAVNDALDKIPKPNSTVEEGRNLNDEKIADTVGRAFVREILLSVVNEALDETITSNSFSIPLK